MGRLAFAIHAPMTADQKRNERARLQWLRLSFEATRQNDIVRPVNFVRFANPSLLLPARDAKVWAARIEDGRAIQFVVLCLFPR